LPGGRPAAAGGDVAGGFGEVLAEGTQSAVSSKDRR
jgi:hypothetical protein